MVRELEARFKGVLDIRVVCQAPYPGYVPDNIVFRKNNDAGPYSAFVEAYDKALAKRKSEAMAESVKRLMLEAEKDEQEANLEIRQCQETTQSETTGVQSE